MDAQSSGNGGSAEERSGGVWKSTLTELQVGSLNRAKKEFKSSVDLLARLAVTKFVRTEMNHAVSRRCWSAAAYC